MYIRLFNYLFILYKALFINFKFCILAIKIILTFLLSITYSRLNLFKQYKYKYSHDKFFHIIKIKIKWASLRLKVGVCDGGQKYYELPIKFHFTPMVLKSS